MVDSSWLRRNAGVTLGAAVTGLVGVALWASGPTGPTQQPSSATTGSVAPSHSRPSRPEAIAPDDLRVAYGVHASEVLDQRPDITASADGFVLAPRPEGGGEGDLDPAPTTVPNVVLHVGRDATAPLAFDVAGQTVRVREVGASGLTEQVAGTVSYPRAGGRSYWTQGDHGVEEWLSLGSGLAYAGRDVAEWQVEGDVSLTQDGADVLVADAGDATLLRVSAPRGWSIDGRAVPTHLSVHGNAIGLQVDANGDSVLVDPSWTAAGSMSVGRGELFVAGRGVVELNDGRVLVAGGYTPTGFALGSADVYSPGTNSWSAIAAMGTHRAYPVSVLLRDGRVLVAGGAIAPGMTTATAEIYDPSSNTWTAIPSMSVARYNASAELLPSGSVLVVGGFSSTPLATCEIYDPATNTWSPTGSLTQARFAHRTTVLASGRILATGGQISGSITTSAELYNPSTGTWSSAGAMAAARYSHDATRLLDGRVLVSAGVGTTGAIGSAEIYDPSSNSWSAAGSLNAIRYNQAAQLLVNGRVLVVGGYQNGSATTLASTELYDPTTNAWTISTPMSAARQSPGAIRLRDGSVLVMGGRDSGGTPLASAERYIPDPICGNRIIELGENCDDGNTASGDCCSSACLVESAGTVCRAATGVCDAAETCNGTSPTCPADAFATAGTACRAAVNECDAAEVCTGSSAACPADAARAPGSACGGAPVGACDAQDTCSGTVGATATCVAQIQPAGHVCRGVAGGCDVAETCDGASTACPADAFLGAGALCRAAVSACDVDEVCAGGTAACPADLAQPAGTACGGSPSGICDAQDTCSGGVGAAATCVANFMPSTTVCRMAAGVCDSAESCTGTDTACPADAFSAPGTVCGMPSCTGGVETVAATCSGSGVSCPVGTTRNCAPYVCGATACLTSCTGDADCSPGNVCQSNVCGTPPPPPPDDAGVDAGPIDGGPGLDGGVDGGPIGDGGPRPDGGVTDGGRRDAGDGSTGDGSVVDGGDAGPAPASSGGCGCSVPGSSTDTRGVAWLVVALGVWIARRRRA